MEQRALRPVTSPDSLRLYRYVSVSRIGLHSWGVCASSIHSNAFWFSSWSNSVLCAVAHSWASGYFRAADTDCGGAVPASIDLGIGVSLNVRNADARDMVGSKAGWWGAKSVNRAVPTVLSSMYRITMIDRDVLYMKRAVLLRAASFDLGRWFGMLPIVPNGSKWDGGVQFLNHRSAGACFVWEWGIALYLYVASSIAKCHISDGRLACCNAHRAASVIVRLSLSAMPFNWGWYGMVVLCFVPAADKNIPSVLVLYSGALSL